MKQGQLIDEQLVNFRTIAENVLYNCSQPFNRKSTWQFQLYKESTSFLQINIT